MKKERMKQVQEFHDGEHENKQQTNNKDTLQIVLIAYKHNETLTSNDK